MHAGETIEQFVAPSRARVLHLANEPLDEVRARLDHALGQEGFVVLNQSDLADMLNRSLDKQRPPYFTYEVLHPKLTEEALAVSDDAGLLFPSRICVWQEGRDVAVATLPASRLSWALGRQHIDEIVAAVEERLERVFARLRERPHRAWAIPPRPPGPLTEFDAEEINALRDATQRQIRALIRERAASEGHPLKDGLARDVDRLESIARKLAKLVPGSADS